MLFTWSFFYNQTYGIRFILKCKETGIEKQLGKRRTKLGLRIPTSKTCYVAMIGKTE